VKEEEMKRKTTEKALILFLVAMAMTMSIGMASAYYPDRDSTVGYWHFDEGSGSIAYDSSEQGNNGTIYGATWTSGKVGGALEFDGIDDFVEVLDDPSLDITDEITIEAWVKPNNVDGYHTIVSKYWGTGYYLRIDPGRTISFAASGTLQTEAGIVPIGSWSHIVGVSDGTYAKIYFNGQLVKSGQIAFPSGHIDTNDYPLRIGAFPVEGSLPFNGTIDEIRILNRTLSAEEIKEDYESPTTTTIFISTDKFGYYTGDTMTITIDIANPTEASVTFQWYWCVPQFSVCVPVMSVPIPAGYEDTHDFSFTIPDWGSTPFGNVFYVQLLDADGEVLDADAACWTYSPGEEVMPAAEVDIAKEIKKTIVRIELPS
jgi:hypothetical protein